MRMFGLSESEAVGRPLATFIPEPFRRTILEAFQEFIDTGTSKLMGQTVEAAGLRADGSTFPLEISLSSWETSEGRFVSSILRDITDRKQC